MHEPVITLSGNVAAPPTVRTVGTEGRTVANFRLAVTPRRRVRGTDEWQDRPTLWFTVSCWQGLAENVAASLQKGSRVAVTGRLGTRAWVGDDGAERSGLEVEATSVALDLSRGPARHLVAAPLLVSSDPGDPHDPDADDAAAAGDLSFVDPVTGELVEVAA